MSDASRGTWRARLATTVTGTALLLVAPGPGPAKAPSGLALIVAISEYPAASGYAPLNATNDVPLVREGLLAQGFDPGRIRVIEDSAADREGLLAGLAWLEATARPGDALVFHYSGHGHRITDDNGDELDGLDEVLVPWGAPARIVAGAGYRGERHLRDDELGRILGRIRDKVGPQGSVAVFLDACYSGSATRGMPGEATVRGVAAPLLLPDAPAPPAGRTDEASGVYEAPRTRGDESESGALVVISAARHDQVARETYDANRNPVGSLSLALSRTLPRLGRGDTWRAAFERIALHMAGMDLYDQRPQMEGAVDALVFGGRLAAQAPYFSVTRVEGDSVAWIRGGLVLGLLPGTTISLHPAGTTDPGAVGELARGVVRRASADAAEAVLERPVPGGLAGRTWAFVTDQAFGDLRVRVKLHPGLAAGAGARIRGALEGLRLVELVASRPDVVIVPAPESRGGEGGALRLTAASDGAELAAAASPDDLRALLHGYARSRTLRRLELSDPRLRVRMELVRTQPRLRVTGDGMECPALPPVPLAVPPRLPEGIVLRPGEEYTLRFVNEGPDAAYVAVLSLGPRGTVDQLYPPRDRHGSDNYLPAGTDYLIPDVCMWADSTAGVEVLRLFATRERLEFEPILTPAGPSRGEALTPLGQLLSDVVGGFRSGPVPVSGGVSTAALSLTIVPTARTP